ncbi:MAG: hypothetical protein JSR21_18775 [Proteobacteria bacterium]|nr:hypothetical protein [Pseudomonadota bacterium]
MDMYRVYLIGFSGHFEAVEVLHCASDDEALSLARGKMHDFPRAEIWSGKRRVGELARERAARRPHRPAPGPGGQGAPLLE